MLCIILSLALLLVSCVAATVLRQQRKATEELEQELCIAISSRRTTKDKSRSLSRKLEATRTELASLTNKHQQEQANSSSLDKKLKESEKTVRLLGQSNRQTRETAHDLISQKVALHSQIASYTQQLRSARADIDNHKEMVGKLQTRVINLEQEKSTLKLEHSRLAAQLASEKEDGMDLTQQIKHKANELRDMTKQLEQAREAARQLDKSNEKGWAEVKAWREDPIRMVGKAEDWRAYLGGEVLLGGERDRGLTWDVWWRMEEKKVVRDVGDELEVRADEEEVVGQCAGEWEEESGQEDLNCQDDVSWDMESEEDSAANGEWCEVGDKEWVEVDDENGTQ